MADHKAESLSSGKAEKGVSPQPRPLLYNGLQPPISSACCGTSSLSENPRHFQQLHFYLLQLGLILCKNDFKSVGQQELSVIGGNGTTTLEDCLAAAYKTKHSLTLRSSKQTLWYLPKGIEHLCQHKNLHPDTDSRFIPICQNLKVTKMSFSK